MNKPTASTSDSANLRRAWRRWAMLTGGCVLAMIVVLPSVDFLQINAETWFIAPVLWLLLAVPATIAMYGPYFRDDRADGAAVSDDYLRGVTSVWSVLAVGVGLSLGACLLAGSASPGIWPGALMLMLLVLARPTSEFDLI